MNFKVCRETVLREIDHCLDTVTETQILSLMQEIISADAIYVDGKGRSGLQANAFAMRLAQMGKNAYVPSGVTTPAISKDNLLLICSGSGETSDLVCHAEIAKKAGAKVILITTKLESTIGKMADLCIGLQARSKYSDEFKSIQPMGSVFEQGIEVLFDSLVVLLMDKENIDNAMMQKLHNNLE